MNKIKITKEEILDKALFMAKQNGLEKLNIRSLAKKCGVSVGCIYYYFNNKNDLIIEVVTKFWNEIFIPISTLNYEASDFIEFIKNVYSVLFVKLGENNLYANSHMNMFNQTNVDIGRINMENYKDRVLKFIIKIMKYDNKINDEAWSSNFSKHEFVDFIFTNVFLSLDKKEKNIDYLCKIVEKIIY